jgi:hypothetical protein
MDIFTLKHLLTVLGRSSNATIVKSEKEEDWGAYFPFFAEISRRRGQE